MIVPTAGKTVLVRQNVALWDRRNHLLQLYAEGFADDAQRFGPSNTITSGVYDAFPGIEQAVDQVIRGLPVEYDLGKGKMIGYYLDPPSYLALHRQLDELSLRWSPTLLKITGRSCPTPCWFRWGMSSQVWTAMEFEMYAVKFRDELETFLHLIYRNRHALEVAPSGEDHSRRQQHRQEKKKYMKPFWKKKLVYLLCYL